MLFDVIIRRENSLGIKPSKGGSPPRERKRAIRDILISGDKDEKELVWGISFIDVTEKINIIGINEIT